jgi:hydroxymethylpyrimidine/phosphomethylpyrimidine kinase
VPRGTGCALSTAIAANLAIGLQLDEAVDQAIALVVGLIEASKIIGNQRMLFPKT